MEELSNIIEGCTKNDRSSQEKLYRMYYVPLYCLCRRFFQNEHEAIESVNDGMLKIFTGIHTYQPAKGRFFNWVYTIVRNTAMDKLRRSVSLGPRPDIDFLADAVSDPSTGHNPVRALEEKDIYRLLDELSPATRLVCNLFYIEGFSVRDVSEELAISTGTVKWHLSESRKKLKTIFDKHYNERP